MFKSVAGERNRWTDSRWVVRRYISSAVRWQHLLDEIFVMHYPVSDFSDLIGRPLSRRSRRDVDEGACSRRDVWHVENSRLGRPERINLGVPWRIRLQNA